MGEAATASAAVVAGIQALSGRARGPLVPVTPDGPLGSPYDGYPVGAVTVTGTGAVEVRMGDGHLRYLLTDPRVVSATDDALILGSSELTEEFIPFGKTEVRVRDWTDARLLLTYDPQTAQGLR